MGTKPSQLCPPPPASKCQIPDLRVRLRQESHHLPRPQDLRERQISLPLFHPSLPLRRRLRKTLARVSSQPATHRHDPSERRLPATLRRNRTPPLPKQQVEFRRPLLDRQQHTLEFPHLESQARTGASGSHYADFGVGVAGEEYP